MFTRASWVLGLLCAGVLAAASVACAADAPVDNPVATFYSGPEGYPAWTDALQWSRVLNMQTYAKGKNNFEKFENARDELTAQGGGVLYYPAGTYDFSEGPFDGPQGRGLMLPSGVVIRGEAPQGHPLAAKDGKLELKTKFVFGFQKKGDARGEVPRDWNVIGLAPAKGQTVKDVNYVGLCWVHLDGAVVFFGPELAWGENWKTANDYKGPNVKDKWAGRKADGTHPYDSFVGSLKPKEGDPQSGHAVGAGKGRLVFGCVLERAAFLNDFETCARREPQAAAGFGPDGYHMAKFTGRISVYGSRVFIANNWLPESQGNFKYQQTTIKTMPRKGNDFAIGDPAPATVLWDYNRTMGIDLNKDCWGLVGNTAKSKGLGYLAEGVAVLDNWVWNHGHKGFNLSGCWGVVRNNANERRFLKGGADVYGLGGGWMLTLDGFIQTAAGGGGMISDNLSRAFDMAGSNLWIDGNFYHSTGSSPGIDGEGILCQGAGGTFLRSWAITHNRHEKRAGHGGYMAAFNVNAWGLLIAWNKTDDFVGMVWRNNEIADLAFVANEAKEVKHYDKALIESKGIPAPPKDVKAEVHEGDAVRIAWSDGSDNEIGFRVDRQIEGGKWAAIAYRPPHIEGSENNPQVWVDFLAPTGRPLTYRVVAVNADDNDKGASAPAPPVTLARPAAR